VLVLIVLLALAVPLSSGGPARQSAAAAHADRAAWDSLSSAEQGEISKAVGGDDAGYWVGELAGIPALSNTAQRFTARFAPSGVEVATGDAHWGLGLAAVGHGDELRPVPAAAPITEANRVSYRRGSINEWYVNGPAGLEQGFTLGERPAGTSDQSLTLALGTPGSLTATVDHGGAGLVLTHGSDSLAYRGLSVRDTAGRALPAHLQLRNGQVLVRVDDRRAQYPITVDPFVQIAKLVASDPLSNSQFGFAVAISGSTVVIGAAQAAVSGVGQGAAYVFTAPASGPSATVTQVAKLTASDGASNAHFGSSVAIDGTTIVVGARSAKIPPGTGAMNTGAVYVFPAPWTGTVASPQHEAAKLAASDGVGQNLLGASVGISGNTIVAGANGSIVSPGGAVYVFSAPWTGTSASPQYEAAKLTASDAVSGDELGSSVSISGNTLVAGAAFATVNGHTQQGAAYVFPAPWTGTAASPQHEAAKLIASDGAVTNQLGFTNQVAISGNTVVAGSGHALGNGNAATGAVYVFVAPAAGWSGTAASPQTETTKLTASDGAAGDTLGSSVSISGGTVVAGADGATINGNSAQGAVYEFVMPLGGWAGPQHETSKMVAADGVKSDTLGYSVAISGTTVAAGAGEVSSSNLGAGYVFQANPAATTTALGVTPSSPVAAGTGETLTATITPGAAGTVQFMDGSTPLGSPVMETTGSASTSATLTSGTHSLTAVFTPADPTSFIGSTSPSVAYTVNPKRPLCIRLCN
jgi:hypothetical protein